MLRNDKAPVNELSKVEIHWKYGSTFGKHGNTFGKHGNTLKTRKYLWKTWKYIENKEIHWRSVCKYTGAHGGIH